MASAGLAARVRAVRAMHSREASSMIRWTVALSPPVRATSKASSCHGPQVRDRAKRVVGRAGPFGPLDAGRAVAGQDPVDGGDAGQRIHPLLLEVEADGDAARARAPGGQFGVQGRHGRLRVGPVAAVGSPGRARGRVERGRPRPRPPGADAVEAAQRDAHAPAERPRAPGARGDELHDLQPLGKTDLTRHAPGSPETYHNIWHCQKS